MSLGVEELLEFRDLGFELFGAPEEGLLSQPPAEERLLPPPGSAEVFDGGAVEDPEKDQGDDGDDDFRHGFGLGLNY
jgi:hypothetical protein